MNPLAGLALATAAFVGLHFLLSHPLRAALARRMGEKAFLGFYSLAVAVPFAGMVFLWPRVEDGAPYWVAPHGWWITASVLMLVAAILLIGSLAKNPAMPNPDAKSGELPHRPATGVFAITRHPMNWSFILWALVHMSLWGSPRNLIVAGGILILAFFGSIGQDRKKERLLGAGWKDWEARTSFLPFGAVAAGKVPLRATLPTMGALIGGIVLWLAVTWFHAPQVSLLRALGIG